RWINPDPAQRYTDLNDYQFNWNNPTGHIDYQGLIPIPLDIFVRDIVDVMSTSIGTGEFEELSWDSENNAFSAGGTVYGRGLTVIQDRQPIWQLSEFGSAFALFRDADKNLRLFVNNYQQHM